MSDYHEWVWCLVGGILLIVVELILLRRWRLRPWALTIWIPLAILPLIVAATVGWPIYEWQHTLTHAGSRALGGAGGVVVIIYYMLFAPFIGELLLIWFIALLAFPKRAVWNLRSAIAGFGLAVFAMVGWFMILPHLSDMFFGGVN